MKLLVLAYFQHSGKQAAALEMLTVLVVHAEKRKLALQIVERVVTMDSDSGLLFECFRPALLGRIVLVETP